MIIVKEITNENFKSEITDTILNQLPNWFGIEESTEEYINTVQNKTFFGAYDGDAPIGFVSLNRNNDYTADLYVMGILEEYHNQGIGKMLIAASEKYLKSAGFKIFMVKTLGESHPDKYYQKTRKFYERVGFYPLEEFKTIWNEDNPCLIMVKTIT